MGKIVSTEEVWLWPEFVAFAERLGIPTKLPTRRLEIILACGSVVDVKQEYMGTVNVTNARCQDRPGGEQCGLKAGHEGKHVWLRGD